MKKNLLIVLLSVFAASGLAQGTIVFANFIPNVLKAPIYGPETGDPTIVKQGNTSAGIPAGIQTYSGAPLSGIDYSVGLYAGTIGTPENSLLLTAITTFRGGANAGLFDGGTVVVPFASEGQFVNVQIRAWDNANGTVTTYEQALQNGIAHGTSAMLVCQLGGASGQGYLNGLTSFNLAVVPEPNIVCLGIIGTAALLMRRRR